MAMECRGRVHAYVHLQDHTHLSSIVLSSAGKQLRVLSLSTKKKKCLSENCTGHFTTCPDKLCMYLYEINTNLADTLPCKVSYPGCDGGLIKVGIFLDGLCGGHDVFCCFQALVSFFDSSESVLNDLQGAVVQLRKSVTETSVIATR